MKPIPEGYVVGHDLPASVVSHAHEILRHYELSYGDVVFQQIGDISYAYRIEQHYDDHVGGILQWHRGVTVYQSLKPAIVEYPKVQTVEIQPEAVHVPGKQEPDTVMKIIVVVGIILLILGLWPKSSDIRRL